MFPCTRPSSLHWSAEFKESLQQKPGTTWFLQLPQETYMEAATWLHVVECEPLPSEIHSRFHWMVDVRVLPMLHVPLRQEAVWHRACRLAKYGCGQKRLPLLRRVLPKLQGDALQWRHSKSLAWLRWEPQRACHLQGVLEGLQWSFESLVVWWLDTMKVFHFLSIACNFQHFTAAMTQACSALACVLRGCLPWSCFTGVWFEEGSFWRPQNCSQHSCTCVLCLQVILKVNGSMCLPYWNHSSTPAFCIFRSMSMTKKNASEKWELVSSAAGWGDGGNVWIETERVLHHAQWIPSHCAEPTFFCRVTGIRYWSTADLETCRWRRRNLLLAFIVFRHLASSARGK